MSATAATTTTATTKTKGTAYTVLSRDESGYWVVVNTATAANAGAAIKAVIAKLSDADQQGTFVAVPSKSWNPVKLKVETKTTLKLETA